MMSFLFLKSCILFSSADILLDGGGVSDSAQSDEQVLDSADSSTAFEMTGVLDMPFDLKFDDCPPSAPSSDSVIESHDLTFDDPGGCVGLNEDDENLVYNYYEYQDRSVAIPESLFSMEVDLVSSSRALFDDHVVLTINDTLVYTSDSTIPLMLSNPNYFQWRDIVEQPMNRHFEPHCSVGCDESYDNQAPVGITYEGSFSVSFSSQDLMTRFGTDSQLELGIYVFGDNDAIDCSLQNIQVSIRFAVPE